MLAAWLAVKGIEIYMYMIVPVPSHGRVNETLHYKHASSEEIDHEEHSGSKEELKREHVTTAYTLAAPGAVMIKAFHTEATVGAMLCVFVTLSVYNVTYVAIEMRSKDRL